MIFRITELEVLLRKAAARISTGISVFDADKWSPTC